MNKGLIASMLALVALLALLTGCGGGDEETLTKAEYVRKGNAICGKWQQARGNLFRKMNQEVKPPVTQAKKEAVILTILKPYGTAVEELADLSLPEGDEKQAEKAVTAMEESYDQARANPGTLMSSSQPFSVANELADDYGLTECTV